WQWHPADYPGQQPPKLASDLKTWYTREVNRLLIVNRQEFPMKYEKLFFVLQLAIICVVAAGCTEDRMILVYFHVIDELGRALPDVKAEFQDGQSQKTNKQGIIRYYMRVDQPYVSVYGKSRKISFSHDDLTSHDIVIDLDLLEKDPEDVDMLMVFVQMNEKPD
ncbi:MAG: hypothetical protein KDA78_17500, partial [Planctomycetaceae bacterium]|nr:hypothetical protein [Planctomycetaceae bacterium]